TWLHQVFVRPRFLFELLPSQDHRRRAQGRPPCVPRGEVHRFLRRYVDGRLHISQRPNAVLDAVGDLTNLLLVDDKRWRQDQRIAKGANKDPVFEAMVRHGPRSLTGSIWRSFDLYGPKQAEVANIANHAAGAPDVVNGGFPFPGDARDFFEDAFLLIDIEGGKRRSTGERVAGVGVAVGELDGGLWSLRHGLVHMMMDQHASHGNGAVAHPLRAGDEVGCNAKSLGGKGRSQPS